MTENSIISSNNCSCVDLELMLDSEEHFFDVVFLVGKDKRPIRAHKCILSLRSPVFKAMFHEHDTNSSEIVIADIEYKAMMELLRFLYSRRIGDVNSISDELLIAAEKYKIDELIEMCKAVIESSEIYVTFALECRVCHECFDATSSLNDHVIAKHANLIRLAAGSWNDSRSERIEPAAHVIYTCKLCESRFLAKCELVEHITTKTHDEAQACKFLCTKCLVSYRSARMLEDHECTRIDDRVDNLVNVVVKTTPNNDAAKRKDGAVSVATRETKKSKYDAKSRKHQKTPCPKCQKMFAYRKSLNDHIIFEHIVPCKADEVSNGVAMELMRLINETNDYTKIEELAIAMGDVKR